MAIQRTRSRFGRGSGGRPIDGAATRAAWIGLLVFLVLYLLGGGSNLPTATPLIVLRPAGILLVGGLLLMPARPDGEGLGPLRLLLAAFTACVATQLVPLPSGLWARLPGHAPLAALVGAAGQGNAWRPLSLTPQFTLGGLLATLTGWVVLLAFARLSPRRRRDLVGVVIVMTLASCLVGMLQVIGGGSSVFYFYKSDQSITGLLANRNHQAALLAATLPLLRVWMAGGVPEVRVRRAMTALLTGLLILGMILLTGSRSGLVLALIGTVAAYTIAPLSPEVAAPRRRGGGPSWLPSAGTVGRWAPLALPVLLVAAAIVAGRDLSIQRATSADLSGEIRLRALPTTLLLARTYFPFGSGLGSFDAVFRIHEPLDLLKPTFFNRAHNDYLELLITGGVLPVIVLVGFLGWAVRMGWTAIRRPWRDEGVLHARAGAAMLLVFAAASLSDYPLRAPLIAAVAAIATCWLAQAGSRTPDRPEEGEGR